MYCKYLYGVDASNINQVQNNLLISTQTGKSRFITTNITHAMRHPREDKTWENDDDENSAWSNNVSGVRPAQGENH